jgi:diaminohydroxyphosphoribosylaminopyrimidine deaminase/5-amino-6-(5-phosphoribosylamino)uracil reductase
MTFCAADNHFMRSALSLARRGLGRVAPNPSVGCVIVKDGIVLAQARTADGGRPHAETIAIEQAGPAARGATVYVTLEPCAHQGQTGPCAEALVKAGVHRVVIACTDPDLRVSGKGVAILKKGGIQVDEGVCRAEAEEINKGFFLRVRAHRQLVTLKIASSADGRVSTPPGQSQWITLEPARAYGHLERSQHDAIAVGVNTVITDDPQLSTRLRGLSHETVRIIFDTHLRVPDTAQILKGDKVWIVCGPEADAQRRDALEKQGIKIIVASDLASALENFAEQGLTRLMIEGGPTLIASFITAGLYDRLLWFRSPTLIGEGRDAVADLGLARLVEKGVLRLTEQRKLGIDTLEIYERVA